MNDLFDFLALLPEGLFSIQALRRKKHYGHDMFFFEVMLEKRDIFNFIEHNSMRTSFYMHPTPRDPKKITVNFIKNAIEGFPNVQCAVKLFRSATAKSKEKSAYCHLDIDNKSEEFLAYAKQIKDSGIKSHLIETFGGYHWLIAPGKHIKEIFDKGFHDKQVSGDFLMPIPGTYQGDFLVKLLW